MKVLGANLLTDSVDENLFRHDLSLGPLNGSFIVRYRQLLEAILTIYCLDRLHQADCWLYEMYVMEDMPLASLN